MPVQIRLVFFFDKHFVDFPEVDVKCRHAMGATPGHDYWDKIAEHKLLVLFCFVLFYYFYISIFLGGKGGRVGRVEGWEGVVYGTPILHNKTSNKLFIVQ